MTEGARVVTLNTREDWPHLCPGVDCAMCVWLHIRTLRPLDWLGYNKPAHETFADAFDSRRKSGEECGNR